MSKKRLTILETRNDLEVAGRVFLNNDLGVSGHLDRNSSN